MIGRDGHNYPDRRGANNPRYKGGRQSSGNGHVYATVPKHPKADKRGRVYEHIIVAERALGKFLPPLAIVHHVDLDGTNNEPANLVICQDQGYHLFLHRRLRALRACGHPDWYCCRHCKKWDASENLYTKESRTAGPYAYHRKCHARARNG